jgi:hypothetical protein
VPHNWSSINPPAGTNVGFSATLGSVTNVTAAKPIAARAGPHTPAASDTAGSHVSRYRRCNGAGPHRRLHDPLLWRPHPRSRRAAVIVGLPLDTALRTGGKLECEQRARANNITAVRPSGEPASNSSVRPRSGSRGGDDGRSSAGPSAPNRRADICQNEHTPLVRIDRTPWCISLKTLE